MNDIPFGVSASGLTLLWLLVIVWLGLFFSTRFGIDFSGRYYLPLYMPLRIFAGVALVTLRQRHRCLFYGVGFCGLAVCIVGRGYAGFEDDETNALQSLATK